MKNNKFLRLLGLTVASMSLTACGGESPYTPLYEVDVTEMRLNYYSLVLKKGEEKQLTASFSPKAAFYHKASYKSSNEDVVRVDEKGKVEARDAGIATITVTVGEGAKAISHDVRVYVGEECKSSMNLGEAAKKQLNYQKSIGTFPDVSEIHEIRDTEFYCNDVINRGAAEDTVYVISKRDGYVGFNGFESDLKAPEGNREDVHYGWAFLTGEDYISHLYHTYNGVKTRMSIPTQSYIGKERIECVTDIIDNLFTRGSQVLIKQNVDSVTESETLADLSKGKYWEYHDDKNDILIYKEEMTDRPAGTMDAEYESNYEIPAGTSLRADQYITYCWHNGVCVAEDLEINYRYTIDGDSWARNMILRYSNKINDDVNVVLPNNSEYRVVDSIYDL